MESLELVQYLLSKAKFPTKFMESNNQFNSLEKAILEWFINNYKDPGLIAQIKAAKLKYREWTKVGFYIGLEVPKNLPPINWSNFKVKGFPISGPKIESDDIEFGGDVLLWGKNGYIDCMELVAFGSFFREHVRNFKLSP